MIDRTNQPLFAQADLITSYTRAQAIADGVLVDVSEWASATKGFHGGFTVPVALTSAVWSDLGAIPERFVGMQDLRGRAHDLLWMASLAARKNHRGSDLLFSVLLDIGWTRRQQYRMTIGAGDSGEAVITILRPDES